MKYHYPPIGVMRSCFKEKFGAPRQSLMLDKAWGIIKLNKDKDYLAAVEQLDSFSHIWVLFVFHSRGEGAWRPKITPPRIELENRVGVFSSRSPHRPNPIGMSAVKLDRIDRSAKDGIEIHCSGVDILDGTPILDIKPYLPYADSIPNANSGWASEEIERHPVSFSEESITWLKKKSGEKFSEQLQLFEQVLSLDPRPTSQRKANPIASPISHGLVFRFRMLDLDIEWKIEQGRIFVQQFIQL